ncbi:MAG TPA: IS110 family transposase [Flavisolibacter sp.]
MKSQTLVAGIDVSKDTLDIYFNSEAGKEHYLKVANDASGHTAILQKLGTFRTYVLEATGPYYLRLAFTLKTAGADVRVENPIAVKRFIQMQLERNKSDKKDARWLYRYGLEREAAIWNLPTEQSLKCTAIMASIDLFTRQITQTTNQLHALEELPVVDKAVKKSLQKIKLTLQSEVLKLEKLLQEYLREWNGEQLKNITSIPGLGKRAVALLIVYTDGFTKIKNHRQLIALAGLAPREHTSGSSVRGRKGICKMGNGHLRNVLYMCSLSAIKHNVACKDLYERLKAAGKRSKVALIAVCNKLLKQAFAIATKGTTYQPTYNSSLH